MNLLIQKTESVKLTPAQQREVTLHYLRTISPCLITRDNKILVTEDRGNGHYETYARDATKEEIILCKAFNIIVER